MLAGTRLGMTMLNIKPCDMKFRISKESKERLESIMSNAMCDFVNGEEDDIMVGRIRRATVELTVEYEGNNQWITAKLVKYE